MLEFAIWILIFVTSGVLVGTFGPIALDRLVVRFARNARYRFGRLKIYIASIVVLSIGTWYLISQLNFPQRIASSKVQEIIGTSGPLTADTDFLGSTRATQSHAIKLDPGRTDLPLVVTYAWKPPRSAFALPQEAAAFMSGAGQKDMKISGAPPCSHNIEGHIGEFASCTHHDSSGQFNFVWNVSDLTNAQDIILTIRLGATAVDGKFELRSCVPKGDDEICGDKYDSDRISAIGEAISVAYGGETVDARHSDKATSNDGVLTVDAVNGTITLKPTITNPFGLTAKQLVILGLLGTVLGAIFGNGILFAIILALRKAKPVPAPIRVPVTTNKPKKL
jgi:hypothetical protein